MPGEAVNGESAEDLPIVQCLPDIIESLRKAIPVVIKAPPGAGKTTGVPPAVMQRGVGGDGQILLIEPRRLAARAAAARLSNLSGTELGRDIGYHVRFDKCVSKGTRLVSMTTGILLRRMHRDPLLEDASCVLLDEFHERSLELDLALGMLQRVRTIVRPELRLVVMSATLDPRPIADFLGDANQVVSDGRAFPVSIRHSKHLSREPVDRQVAEILPKALSSSGGDVLVFLPGVGEIRRTRRAIEPACGAEGISVEELYGDLPPAAQDALLSPSDRRKVILATNVAETSVTIPGVTCVIDSGLARVMQFDTHVGLPKLQLEPISQASAEQRAGRAGRTRPGVCYRLWPAAMHRARRQSDKPEIERSDFSAALLSLAAWDEHDIDAFPWLTPPPTDAVSAARKLLQRLAAIDEFGKVTDLGLKMLSLPLHPRLSRLMIEARRLRIETRAAIAAAMLSERDPFRGGSSSASPRGGSGCDITDKVERLELFHDGDTSAVPNAIAARQVKRVTTQIVRLARSIDVRADDAKMEHPLRHALLAAYPDRVAKRRKPGSDQGVMVGRRGVRLVDDSQVVEAELFLCIDIDSRGTEATVRAACGIEEDWLDPRLLRESEEPFFHPTLKSVVSRRRRYYEDLLLSEVPIECHPGPEVASILARNAALHLEQVMPKKEVEVSGFIQRVRFLTQWMPELQLPPLDEVAIGEVLADLCQSRTSFEELRAAPWLEYLRGRFDYEQTRLIDANAPSRMTVPSGNAMTVRYAAGTPPVMEVRIQELFGWERTPRIAGGKVPLQLHLLGPNHRPQQITEDLGNFWRETYAHVRKELKRRYPKHHWPDDPSSATATRNGLKPRS